MKKFLKLLVFPLLLTSCSNKPIFHTYDERVGGDDGLFFTLKSYTLNGGGEGQTTVDTTVLVENTNRSGSVYIDTYNFYWRLYLNGYEYYANNILGSDTAITPGGSYNIRVWIKVTLDVYYSSQELHFRMYRAKEAYSSKVRYQIDWKVPNDGFKQSY